MSYFVLLQNADDGSLRLLTPNLLPTQEQALEAVGAALRDNPYLRSAGVFLAELESASPILFVEPAPPLAELEASEAGDVDLAEADEAAVAVEPEAAEHEMRPPESVEGATVAVFDYQAYEVAFAATAAEGLGAEALADAAASSEEEGPVAPFEPAVAERQAELQAEPTEWGFTVPEVPADAVEPEAGPAEPMLLVSEQVSQVEVIDAKATETGPAAEFAGAEHPVEDSDQAVETVETQPAPIGPESIPAGPEVMAGEQGPAPGELGSLYAEAQSGLSDWEPLAVEPEAVEAPESVAQDEQLQAVDWSEPAAQPGHAAEPIAEPAAVPEVGILAQGEPAAGFEAPQEAPWTPPLAEEQTPPETVAEAALGAVDTSWPASTVAEDAEVLAAIASLGPPEGNVPGSESTESQPAEEPVPAQDVPVLEASSWTWIAGSEAPSEPLVPDEEVVAEPWVPADAVRDEATGEVALQPADSEVPLEVQPPTSDAVESGEIAAEPPLESAASFGPEYEAGGDLDLSAYTCSDCVYVNTCPKVGQLTPQECGSFQWRSS